MHHRARKNLLYIANDLPAFIFRQTGFPGWHDRPLNTFGHVPEPLLIRHVAERFLFKVRRSNGQGAAIASQTVSSTAMASQAVGNVDFLAILQAAVQVGHPCG